MNAIIKLACVCIAADIIYELNKKHNVTGKIVNKLKRK